MSVSDKPGGIPKFVWIAGVVLLTAVVGYAIVFQQGVDEVKMPGVFEAKFRPPQPDAAVLVPVSYDADRIAIEGTAMVQIGGAEPIRLAIGAGQAFHTARVSLPRPGTYAYRIELRETHAVNDDRGRRVAAPFNMTGEGNIDVRAGSGFTIRRILTSGYGRNTWSASLKTTGEESRRGTQEELERILSKD